MTSTFDKSLADLPRRLWTADEYERAGDLGLFRPEERLELVAGEILVKMSPQGSRHAAMIDLVAAAFRGVFSAGFVVRIQTPLSLGPADRPEPDVAVVTGTMRQYLDAHPTTAELVVEISDTTLMLDRTLKAQTYAAAGISEFWIVNLVDDVLEVYRDPAPDPDNSGRHLYSSITSYASGQTIAPLAALDRPIPVADLLP